MDFQSLSARPTRKRRLAWRLVVLGLVSLSMSGCGGWSCRRHHAAVARPGMDPFDLVNHVQIRNGVVSGRTSSPLPSGSYPTFWFTRAATPGPLPPAPGKIHPRLLDTLAAVPPNQPLTLLVTLRDTVQIPPFPRVAPKDSGQVSDSLRLVRARAMADSLRR